MASIHKLTAMYFLVSITAWFLFVVAYSFAYDLSGVGSLRDFSHEGVLLLGNPTLWAMLPVCVFGPLLVDVAYSHARRFWWPTLLDVVQEWDRWVLGVGCWVLGVWCWAWCLVPGLSCVCALPPPTTNTPACRSHGVLCGG